VYVSRIREVGVAEDWEVFWLNEIDTLDRVGVRSCTIYDVRPWRGRYNATWPGYEDVVRG
jgi:hypothetical protein